MTCGPVSAPGDRPLRHDLILIAPADWPQVTATCSSSLPIDPKARRAIEQWGLCGRPVVARRSSACDTIAGTPVGLPLPPSLGRLRISLMVPEGIAFARRAGVGLAEAAATAPDAWHATIDALTSLGARLGLVPEVFGALLWQTITGLPYLHAGSDLDLLWRVGDRATIPPLLDGLARVQSQAPMAIDGEVLTACGGIAWREFARVHRGEADHVMAKTIDRVVLLSRAAVLSEEAAPCC